MGQENKNEDNQILGSSDIKEEKSGKNKSEENYSGENNSGENNSEENNSEENNSGEKKSEEKKAGKKKSRKKSDKEKLVLDFHMNDFAGLAILIAVSIIIAVLLNILFFAKPKVSRLSMEGEKTTVSLKDSETIQPFWAPTNKVKGFYVYMKNESGVNNGVYFTLNDSTLGDVCYWEIAPEQIKDGEAIYLDLEGKELEKGAFYYLNAWTDDGDDSDVGILAVGNMQNGYGADQIDGYVWAHQVVYSGFSVFVLIIEALCILIAALIFILTRSNEKKEVILSMAYFGMAILYFLTVPANSVINDEYSFYRAYTITKGNILPTRNDSGEFILNVPESLPEGMDNLRRGLSNEGSQFAYLRQSDMLTRPLDTCNLDVNVSKEKIKSIIFYIPQVVGLFIAGNVSNNYFLYYFDGRFMVFLISTILIVCAFKLFPEGKEIIFTVASIPLFLINTVSFSAEGFMAVIALLHVALMLGVRKKETLTAKDRVIIILSDVIISCMTLLFLPLVLLTLLISRKEKLLKVGTVIMSVIIFILRNVILYGSVIVIPKGFELGNILTGGILGNRNYILNVIIFIIFLAILVREIYIMLRGKKNFSDDHNINESSVIHGLLKDEIFAIVLVLANMCSLASIYHCCV